MSRRPLCSAAHTALLIDVDKGVRPCCAYEGDHLLGSPSVAQLGQRDLVDILTTSPWTDVREQLANGVVPKGCVACVEREKLGGWSQRIVMEKRRSPNWDRGITYLELSTSNVCNLQCRHCTPLFSSRWSAHDARLGRNPSPIVQPDGELLLRNLHGLDLRHLEYVVVKGGEPMLNSDFAVLLDHLEAIGVFGNVVVDMVTNGTVVTPDLLDRLRRCRELRVCLSIDGHGPVQTYVRHGSSALERVEKAVAVYAAMPNVVLTRNTSVMAYNVFCLDRIDAWWDGLATRFPGRYLRPAYGLFVLSPETLSIACLQDPTRRALVEKYTRLDAARYAPVIRMLEQPWAGVERHDAFVEWTERVDRELGRRVLDSVPELADEMRLLDPEAAVRRAEHVRRAVVAREHAEAEGKIRAAADQQEWLTRKLAMQDRLATAWRAVERGDLDGTEAELSGMTATDDIDAAAVLHLQATLAFLRGDHASALAAVERACALQPDNRNLRLGRARLFEAMGRRDAALVDALAARSDATLQADADALIERCRPR